VGGGEARGVAQVGCGGPGDSYTDNFPLKKKRGRSEKIRKQGKGENLRGDRPLKCRKDRPSRGGGWRYPKTDHMGGGKPSAQDIDVVGYSVMNETVTGGTS